MKIRRRHKFEVSNWLLRFQVKGVPCVSKTALCSHSDYQNVGIDDFDLRRRDLYCLVDYTKVQGAQIFFDSRGLYLNTFLKLPRSDLDDL